MSTEENLSLQEVKIAKCPTVPIKLLKRRKQTNKDVMKLQRNRSVEIRRRARKIKSRFRRPAHFIAEARIAARDKMRLARNEKKKAPIAPPTNKLGIVVRVLGEIGLSSESRQVLHLLRLTSKNRAVFVKISQAMLDLLAVIQPFIVWGYADIATVRNLIFKRGRTQVGAKVRSIDNAVVEQQLGTLGVLCIEDIIYELVTLGTHMRQVLQFLLPFHVSPPTGGWMLQMKKAHHACNQRAGNRDELISQLIHKMV